MINRSLLIMTEETKFYESNKVIVTSARFVVDSETYVVRNISSVKAVREDPQRTGPNGLIVIGILGSLLLAPFLLAFPLTIVALFSLTIVGLFWRMKQKPDYSLILTTSAGEVSAIESKDVKMIAYIKAALDKAIISHW